MSVMMVGVDILQVVRWGSGVAVVSENYRNKS